MTMSTIKINQGPLTITIEGLPEAVRPDGVRFELGLRFREGYDDPDAAVAAFVETFAELGGSKLFRGVDPEREFSCRTTTKADSGAVAEVQLYPPTDRPPLPVHIAAIADALAVEKAVAVVTADAVVVELPTG
jgi:hypothetical protein